MEHITQQISEKMEVGALEMSVFPAGNLVPHLYGRMLNRLSYVFLADWPWIDHQLSKREIPALAFCHILGSILLWNSATDCHSLTNPKIYAAAINHVLSKICVKGQLAHGSTVKSNTIQLADLACSPIELLDLDNKFSSMLSLDGFFMSWKSFRTTY
ncbi:hypothetical protein PsorP6_015193 [Peronosclerospora sorghi]|uniref:Uncharacterized protein n=1 Tax=Peronosclerospora sorghi TaxID=230839 RepID=A0ACC0VVF7_9STRA|nr:hypothetical protein PsorP6_015193 [Peronosclerospora sorghi]